MKLSILYLCIALFGIVLLLSCSSEGGGGNCSVSCGGFGTGQPFVQTNHPGVSESKCVQIGKDKNDGSCKASFCPPTGDPDDCYRVYP